MSLFYTLDQIRLGNGLHCNRKQAFAVTGLLFIFYSNYSISCLLWEVIVVAQRWLLMHGLITRIFKSVLLSSCFQARTKPNS